MKPKIKGFLILLAILQCAAPAWAGGTGIKITTESGKAPANA